MKGRSLMRKLIRTRNALGQTIEKILDINRRRKTLDLIGRRSTAEAKLNEELRILNQIASQQAQLVKKYESDLALQEI